MDEIKKLTNHIEYLFLRSIITGLRDGSITTQEAKNYAVFFLQLEPFTSIEDIKDKLTKLVLQNPKFDILKEYIDVYHDEKKLGIVIEKMKKYIKDKKIDEALEVAKYKS